MTTYTTNYNLKKPAQEDFYNVEDFNSNADILDTELKALSDGTTAEEILNKLKTVDGEGSGLDADLFQGKTVIPVENGGTSGKTASEAIKNLGLAQAFYPSATKQYTVKSTDQPGWYTLASFDGFAVSAIFRLQGSGHWEEGLWIFVDSNYFSEASPTINIIGNTNTTKISKFRCNCSSPENTGTFTLDAYMTPTHDTHTLTMAVYHNSLGNATLPDTIALSQTGTERAVVEHRAPCGFEGSYMVRKQEVTLLNGWTLADGNAVIYQMGRLCFFSMTIKGGTAGVGEHIFRLPTGTIPSVEEPVTNIIRRGTQMNYNIGVRTDNSVRFSSLPQPAYKAEDELTITAVWEAK